MFGTLHSVRVFRIWGIFRQRIDLVTETAMSKQLVIEVKWDSGARVWVATSQDVPGVAVEADTTNETMDILKDVIFDLMEANGIEAK